MKARLMLGTPEVHWLWDPDPRFDDIVFFISVARLDRRSPNRTLPKALHRSCFDSASFSYVKKFGRWPYGAAKYVTKVRRWYTELGEDKVLWIAPQDWMCEPSVIYGGWHNRQYYHGTREARGLAPGDPEQDLTTAVRIHQRFTVDNFIELRSIAPDLPIIPVLQGQSIEDYEHCARMYEEAGIDLAAEPVVGLGSVCRRESTQEIAEIVDTFHARGFRLHGFGVKTDGLALYGDQLVTADSQAWSFGYRKRQIRLSQCTHGAKTCANCKEGALRWHQRIISAPPRPLRPITAAGTSPWKQDSLFAA